MIGTAPKCLDCRYFQGHDREEGLPCDAFPGGIPDEILMGGVEHTKPYPGDHGIQFEPTEPERKETPA